MAARLLAVRSSAIETARNVSTICKEGDVSTPVNTKGAQRPTDPACQDSDVSEGTDPSRCREEGMSGQFVIKHAGAAASKVMGSK